MVDVGRARDDAEDRFGGGDEVGGRFAQPPGFIGFAHPKTNDRVENNTYSF